MDEAETLAWRYVRGVGLTRSPTQLEHVLHPRLGCELGAHRDLGFCANCRGKDKDDELDRKSVV